MVKKSRNNERDRRFNSQFLFNAKGDAEHDEIAERAYMKRQMDARRRLERLRLIKELSAG